MQDLLNKLSKFPQPGDIVSGRVLEIGKSSVFVDLGSFGTGILLGREFKENRQFIKSLKVGDDITAMVVEPENEKGLVELSLQAAHREQAWDALLVLKDKGEAARVRVAAANRGGLIVELMGVAGFLPVSQLSYEHYPRVEQGDRNKILQELNKFVNRELVVRVIDADSRQQKLIVSEKAEDEEKMKQALRSFEAGEIVEGTIAGVVNFGAFVRLPRPGQDKAGREEVEGLIHISEIDWQLIEDPRQILKAGEKVTVKIIGIDGDRLSLSLKALKPDPWLNINEKYQKGQEVEGAVTKINPFGAFVRLDKDIHGLVHVSDFGSAEAMNSEIKVGQNYHFKILSLEASVHRLALSLVRQVEEKNTDEEKVT